MQYVYFALNAGFKAFCPYCINYSVCGAAPIPRTAGEGSRREAASAPPREIQNLTTEVTEITENQS